MWISRTSTLGKSGTICPIRRCALPQLGHPSGATKISISTGSSRQATEAQRDREKSPRFLPGRNHEEHEGLRSSYPKPDFARFVPFVVELCDPWDSTGCSTCLSSSQATAAESRREKAESSHLCLCGPAFLPRTEPRGTRRSPKRLLGTGLRALRALRG